MNEKALEAGQGFEGSNTNHHEVGDEMNTTVDHQKLEAARPKWATEDSDIGDRTVVGDRMTAVWERHLGPERKATGPGDEFAFSAFIGQTDELAHDGTVMTEAPRLWVSLGRNDFISFENLDAAVAGLHAALAAVQDARRYLLAETITVAEKRREAAHDAYREAARLGWGPNAPQFQDPAPIPGVPPELDDFSFQEALPFPEPSAPCAILDIEDHAITVAVGELPDTMVVDEAWDFIDRFATAVVLAEHHQVERRVMTS